MFQKSSAHKRTALAELEVMSCECVCYQKIAGLTPNPAYKVLSKHQKFSCSVDNVKKH